MRLQIFNNPKRNKRGSDGIIPCFPSFFVDVRMVPRFIIRCSSYLSG